MPKAKKENLEIKYEWQLFAESFLALSEVGCDKMLNNKYFNGKPEGFWQRKLFISIIYSFKHSIEIVLKTFIKLFCPNKFYNEHNIQYLFNIVYPEIEKSIDKIYKEIREKISKPKFSLDNFLKTKDIEQHIIYHFIKQEIEQDKNGNFLKDELRKLKEITDKYFNLKLIDKKFIKIQDFDNTIFKYPEQKNNSIKINYLDLVENEKNFEELVAIIKTIKQDIGVLRGVLRRIAIYNDFLVKNNATK